LPPETIQVALVSGAISFAAAVIAVVIGQYLGQRFQRVADERRWERQEVDRRRIRAEEAAEEVLTNIEAATRLLREFARAERYDPRAYPPQDMLRPMWEGVRRAVTRVPEQKVTVAGEMAADILYYYEAEQMSLNTWELAWTVEREVRAVVSAYLTGREIPSVPETDKVHREVLGYQEWLDKLTGDSEAAATSATEEQGGARQ
jgi:hypothetical protein